MGVNTRHINIAIISDIHLEFENWMFNEDIFANVDLIINAGDTHPKASGREMFASWMPPGMPYFEILGNHDYWKSEPNLFMDDSAKKTIEVNGFKIAGAPLWTNISNPLEWEQYKDQIPDWRYMGRPAHIDYMNVYADHKNYLKNSEADVIVSHHMVHRNSMHPKWKTSALNFVFLTDISDEILEDWKKPPMLWVNGHTHDPSDFVDRGTRFICNPRGYPGERSEYTRYRPVYVTLEK